MASRARRGADDRLRRAEPRHARGRARGGAVRARGRAHRERDQGHRERLAHVHGRGARRRSSRPTRAGTLAFLSGPSFAKELADQLPTAVVIAAHDAEVGSHVMRRFHTPYLRTYASDDVVGVECGGALKNVIAIAAGAVDGIGFGHNTRAALITRGLAEMAKLAMARGGSALTLAGPRRDGRSRAHVHRRALAKPDRRLRARAGAYPRPRSSPTSGTSPRA